MSFVTWQFDLSPYSPSSRTWSGLTTLTSFHDVDVQVASGDSRDSFQFKLTNFNNERLLTVKPNDKITIYRAVNSTTVSTSDLLMVGTVAQVIPEETDRNDMIRVEGYNFSETVMSAIAFGDLTSKKVDEAIQELLNSVGLYAEQFKVSWHPDNPSVRTDGSAFPVVGERFFNRPLRSIIDKLSTKQVTGDSVQYYWYVDKDNRLVWRPKSTTTSGSFNANTDEYKACKVGKDVKDVKNYVIIKGGVDPNGVVIQTKYYDAASVAKHRAKYLIITDETKYALNIHKADCDKAGVRTMKDYSFGTFTPTWTTTTYNSFNSYVDGFRAHVKAFLVEKGKQAVETTLNGKLSLNVEFAPGKGWALGQQLPVTHPAIGTSAKNMRVIDIQYNTDADVFTLEEDIGSL